MAAVAVGYYSVVLKNSEWLIPTRYSNVTYLGHGSFGQVCSAFDKVRNMKVAIKKLSRPFLSAIHAKRAFREIRILKNMHHDNILFLLDLFTPDGSAPEFDVYLVTHLMQADLDAIIKSQSLTENHVQLIVYQLLRGLKYLHSAGIIHRDLKPCNIGINEDCDIRILDFGLARPADAIALTGYIETRWYRAPEVILNWMQYSLAVDVWAVGCIMAELILRRPLLPGTDFVDQLRKTFHLTGTPDEELLASLASEDARKFIATLPKMVKQDFKQVFHGASQPAIDLLERMLEINPAKRITVDEALSHEFLQQYADVSDEPMAERYQETYEGQDLDIDAWKGLILQEILTFVPPPN